MTWRNGASEFDRHAAAEGRRPVGHPFGAEGVMVAPSPSACPSKAGRRWGARWPSTPRFAPTCGASPATSSSPSRATSPGPTSKRSPAASGPTGPVRAGSCRRFRTNPRPRRRVSALLRRGRPRRRSAGVVGPAQRRQHADRPSGRRTFCGNWQESSPSWRMFCSGQFLDDDRRALGGDMELAKQGGVSAVGGGDRRGVAGSRRERREDAGRRPGPRPAASGRRPRSSSAPPAPRPAGSSTRPGWRPTPIRAEAEWQSQEIVAQARRTAAERLAGADTRLAEVEQAESRVLDRLAGVGQTVADSLAALREPVGTATPAATEVEIDVDAAAADDADSPGQGLLRGVPAMAPSAPETVDPGPADDDDDEIVLSATPGASLFAERRRALRVVPALGPPRLVDEAMRRRRPATPWTAVRCRCERELNSAGSSSRRPTRHRQLAGRGHQPAGRVPGSAVPSSK